MNLDSLDNLIEVFGDLVSVLTNMARHRHEMIGLQAFDHLKKCIEYLVDNTQKEQEILSSQMLEESTQQS